MLRHRDLLPMPCREDIFGLLNPRKSPCSAAQKCRVRRKACAIKWLCDGVDALHSMAGLSALPSGSGCSEAQRAALLQFQQKYCDAAFRITKRSPQAAWQEFLRSKGGYTGSSQFSSVSAGMPTVFRPDTTKLPSGGAGQVRLEDVAPAHIAVMLQDGRGILNEAYNENMKKRPPAMDPLLHRRVYTYGKFLEEVFGAQIISQRLTPVDEAGAFFVSRKDGRNRMIVDPVGGNARCLPPLHTALPSLGAISSIESRLPLAFRSGDVEVCYFQYELPEWAKPLFCFPGIEKRYLPPRMQARYPDKNGSDKICFAMRVVPMGWTWSAFLITSIQEALISPIAPMPFLYDKRYLPAISVADDDGDCIPGVRALMIDNFVALCPQQAEATRVVEESRAVLADKGIRSSLDPEDA